MKKIDVQGTKVYIVSPVPDTDYADCTAASTAILAGKEALCPQSLGELTRTREITEYGCISSNESVKATGKMSYGDFSMELLFDPTDAAGQKELFDAMENNTPIILGVVAPDSDGKAGSVGSFIWTKAMISGDGMAFPANGLMGYNVTLAPYGGFNRCPVVNHAP